MRNECRVRVRAVLGVSLLAVTAACAHIGGNFRTVEEGTFYRSGQLSAAKLETQIRRHHLRTVINLRGVQPDEPWYREELAVCEALGVAHHDLPWSMKRLPEPESLATLVALFETAEKPLLVHCQGGVHRAAIASACYLLSTGAETADARRQLGLFFNNAPIGRLLDLYDDETMPFDQWVAERYPALYAREQGAEALSEAPPRE